MSTRQLSLTVAAALLCSTAGRAGAQDIPAVFIHGLASSGSTWTDASVRLASTHRITPLRPDLPWREEFPAQASQLQAALGRLPESTIAIGHSNGGLVAREWSRAQRLGGLVTLGTPHYGAPPVNNLSAWATFLVYAGTGLADVFNAVGSCAATACGAEWMLVEHGLDGVLSQLFSALSVQFAGLAVKAGIQFGTPVFLQMQAGSSYLRDLNAPANLAREAAEVPARVGIVVTARNYAAAGPFRAIWPEEGDAIARTMAFAATVLDFVGLYLIGADPYNPPAVELGHAMLQASAWIQAIDPMWCEMVSLAGGGECWENDTLLPIWTQVYPDAMFIHTGNQGPAHIRQTVQSHEWLDQALTDYLGVPRRESPPAGGDGDACASLSTHRHEASCGSADECGHVFGSPADCGCPEAPASCTPPADATPDIFTFTDRLGVGVSAVVRSDVVRITGIDVAVPISVAGAGAYRVCSDSACADDPPFTTAPSQVAPGQHVQLRVDAPPTEGTAAATTLTVGTAWDTWSVRTAGDPCVGTPEPGDLCDDGTVFAGDSPDGQAKMFTTPADAGLFQFAWPETVDRGYSNWTTGEANTLGLARHPEYIAAAHCANLVAHGKSDWYLPAPHELDVLRRHRQAIRGFALDPQSAYWTSAENGGDRAWYQRLDGFTGWTTKGVALRVRCVRRDMAPGEFRFADRIGVAPGSPVYSNVLRLDGLSGPTAISVSGGDAAYRVCGDAACSADPPFTTAAGRVADGEYLQLRLTSSGAPAGVATATVAVGTLADTWSVRTAGACLGSPVPGEVCDDGTVFAGYSPDGQARMYTTPADAGAMPFAWPESVDHGYTNWTTGRANSLGLSQYPEYQAARYCTALAAHGRHGWYLPSPAEMDVLRRNGAAIGGLDLSAGAHYWTAAEAGENRAWYHRMDGFTGWTSKGLAFLVRCVRRETSAAEFTFTDRTGVAPGTVIDSNVIPLALYTPVTVSVSGGAYRVCGDPSCAGAAFTTAPSAIADGQYLQLRLTSSSSFATTVSATVTAGSLSDTWSVTTASQDVTPDPFSFVDRDGVPVSTVVDSNVVRITGITGQVATSITGGAYRICGDSACSTAPAFATAPSAVTAGQYLQLRVTSSGAHATTVAATMTVGNVSDTWTVRTLGDPCAGAVPPGTVCADGTKFAGYSPDGSARMFTTPADAGVFQFAWPEWVDHGHWSWITGEANTLGMAQYAEYHAARYCAGLVAHGRDDWYLPAPYEMDVLRQHAGAIGGFDLAATYWTGTEWVDNLAMYHRMSDGFHGYTSKGIGMRIRCVRKD
ncbi:MAG TPA: hypothetical protein VNI83_02755 [Vicinamibacterales bacterium]|nr:hypothetical protein [Vicinamibacterales bacterium]